MNPYDELMPYWRRLDSYFAMGARTWPDAYESWLAACIRICGEDVSIEWDIDGCTVAGAMRFERLLRAV